MKIKHIFWFFSAVVAVVTMAVGVAVLVDRFISRRECPDGYLDCSDDTEEYIEQE